MAKDFDNRVENIKLMHETMLCMNNENAYMTWIYDMPDCPSEWDIEDIAEDMTAYLDLVKTFISIVKRYGGAGLVAPSRAVYDFQMKLGLGLEIFDAADMTTERPTYAR